MADREPLLGDGDGDQGSLQQQVAVHVQEDKTGETKRTSAGPIHTRNPDKTQPEVPLHRGLALGLLGILLTTAALVLHYSGLEPVDLSFQDDQCFYGPNITSSGLPVDACLTRQAADQASECGVAAANAFCVDQGGNYHVNFTMTAVDAKGLGAISLGNAFVGGRLTFEHVCCDVGKYQPAWSRWLLLVGGTLLLYWLSTVITHMLLALLELMAGWLSLDAGEVLYFLLGTESPLSWVLFGACLLWWIKFSLWVVWCGHGVDCESHGTNFRQELYSVAEVILLFSVGSLFAKAAPRVISMRYLYAGQFAHVRDTMRKESLLGALTRDEVRDIVRARQQRQAAAAAQSRAAGAGTAASSTTHGGGHGSMRRRPHQDRHSSRQPPGGVDHAGGRVDLRNMLEISGLGGSGAVARFKAFLARYSTATEDELAKEAAAEGEVLYDNLVGAWDVNDDGAVGLQDFEELFRQVKPPPGFASPRAAAQQAWAMFDLNRDGRLGKEEVVKALAAIYLDRANTARTVLSNESAVRSLEAAIGFVLYTLLLFAAAHILGVSLGTSESQSTLDFFTTYVLALSFIFGDTVRSVFRSTLYLFGEQPFSVGDYLEIDDELWCVEAFDLVYTQLRKWEYNVFSKVPNDMLIDSKLVNVSRGGAFKDTIPFEAPLGMPMEAISELKALLVEAGDARPKDVVPGSPHVKIDSIDSGQIMNVQVEWVYNFPPGDRQRMDDVREYMVAKTKDALVAVGIVDQELNLNFKFAKKKGGGKSKQA